MYGTRVRRPQLFGSRCYLYTHISLFVLAVAFLHMYDFPESLNLCAFLLTTIKLVMIRLTLLYAMGRAEVHASLLAPMQART